MNHAVIQMSRRAFTWFVVLVTILATFMPMLAVNAVANAAVSDVQAGDFIRKDGQTSVHYINSDLKRQFLAFEWTYRTWRENFAAVKVLPGETDLDAVFPSASRPLVGPRGGSVLMKSPDSPRLYAMGCGGMLHWLVDGNALSALYGSTWEFHDMPGYLLALFPQGESLDGSKPHCGQVVRFVEGGPAYVVGEDGKYHMVDGTLPSVVRNVRVVSEAMKNSRMMGDTTVAAASLVANPGQLGAGMTPGTGTSTPPAAQGAVAVTLAASTPDPGNVPISVDNIVFTRVVLTNNSASEVTVNSFKLSRSGLGATGDFTSVTLYEGAVKVGLTRTSWTTDGYMNYNVAGGFKVPARSAKTIDITGRLGTAGTYNALGIAEVSASGGTVSGLPVVGNQQSGVNVTVGTVTMTGQGTETQTKNIGTTGVTFGQFRLALSSVEDGKLVSIRLKNKGTAADGDVANLWLQMGTENLAGPVRMSSDYVDFVLANPYLIQKSKNATFKVVGDIVDGSSRTVEFVLDATTDLLMRGQTYRTPMSVTATGFDAIGDSGTTLTTVGSAELNVGYTGTPIDTADDRLNVNFGRLVIGAGSSMVKITNIVLTVDETNSDSDATNNKDVDELELQDASDGSINSGVMTGGGDTNANDETWTFNDEVIIDAGKSRSFDLVGDLPDGIGDNDTYRVTMTVNTTTISAETLPAGDTVTNFSVGSISGVVVTVRSPSLVISSISMNAGNPVINEENVVLYSCTLEPKSGDVRVERMKFEGATTTAGNTTTVATNFDADNWSQVGLYVDTNGDGTLESQQVITSGNLTDGEIDFNSVSFNLVPGKVYACEVRGTLKASFTSNTTVQLQLDTVTARDKDATSVTSKTSAGVTIQSSFELTTNRNLTLRSRGVLYVSMRNSDTGFNKDRIVLAGDGSWVGKLRLRAQYEGALVRDLKLTNANTTSDDSVQNQGVCLYKAQEATAANRVACTSLGTDGIAFFDDINVSLEEGTYDWYIYVMTTRMGDLAGATADTKDAVRFQVATTSANVVARGLKSNVDYSFGDLDGSVEVGEIVLDFDQDASFDEGVDNQSSSTKQFDLAGSKITNVSLVSSYGGETVSSQITGTGEYTLAILKLETASHSNADANGQALKLGLGGLLLDVDKHNTTTLSGGTIKRIGGTQSATALTVTGADGVGETSGDWTLTSATSSLGVDAQIDSGVTAYFVIKGTISGLDTTSGVVDHIRVSLDKLGKLDDQTSNNIDWLDGYDTTYAITNDFDYLNLDITNITGTKIAENLNT